MSITFPWYAPSLALKSLRSNLQQLSEIRMTYLLTINLRSRGGQIAQFQQLHFSDNTCTIQALKQTAICVCLTLKASYFWSSNWNPSVSVCQMSSFFMSRDSSAGLATRYRLDGLGIESRKGRDFPHLFRPALRPSSNLHNGYQSFQGIKRPGRDGDHPPHPVPRVKKE
jgi:hypothetical protein